MPNSQLGAYARIAIFCLLALAAFPLSLCHADGGFVPPETYPGIPGIPGQTALIVFDRGVETLVVESSAQTSGAERLAWIVPLPNAPRSMRKVSPGALQTLRFCIGTRLIGLNVSPLLFTMLLMAALISVQWAEGILTGKTRRTLITRLVEGLIVVGIIAALASISVSSPPGQQVHPSADAETLQRQRVGNYEVSVVRAQTPGDLDRWLQDNRFVALPSRAQDAVSSYIDEGWVFLIARLERLEGRDLTPHPLGVSFETPEPIYPMRLTAMGDSTTELHLYIAGRERFSHSALETVCSDRFIGQETLDDISRRAIAARVGPTVDATYAQPELMELIADSMWLTYLRGAVEPVDMGRDFTFLGHGASSDATQNVELTHFCAVIWALTVALILLCIAAPLWALWLRSKRRKWLGRLALPMILSALGFGVYMGLPKNAHVVTAHAYHPPAKATYRHLQRIRHEVLEDESIPPKRKTARMVERFLQEVDQPFQPGHIRQEASPGNFTVGAPHGDEERIYFYGDYGHPFALGGGESDTVKRPTP